MIGTTRSVLLLSLLLVGPAKGVAEEGSVVGGAMRFATEEEAFLGGFAGVSVAVWRIEPYAYLSHDAGVWAIQAGVAVPVVRRSSVLASIRFGTSTAVSGPAVEPNVTPTLGAGVRAGRRIGVLAEVDRARSFTLARAGLFVRW